MKNVLLRTLIHERAPDALRGRAFAAYNGARNGAELGALVLGGVVVGALGARTALLAAGHRAGRDRGARLLLLVTRRRAAAATHHNRRESASMHASRDDLEPDRHRRVRGPHGRRGRDAHRVRVDARAASRPTSRRSRGCPTTAASATTGATCSRARSASPSI